MEKINKKMQEIKEKDFVLAVFKDDLNTLFQMLNHKIQEENLTLSGINKDNGSALIEVIDKLEKIRYIFFKFCCDFSTKEVFDIAFCYYRDFLIEIAKVESKIDEVCIGVFGGQIKEYTIKIQENKKNIKIINNDNIKEHSSLHKYNEQYYKIIEELKEKRKQLLICLYN